MMMGISFFVKVGLIGGTTAFVFWYNKLSRSPFAQIKRIEKVFRKPLDVSMPHIYLERKDTEELLRKRFHTTPNGPLMIIGQDGTGKTSILQKVCLERGWRYPTVFVDLQKYTIDNPAELIFSIATAIGYKTPNDQFLFRWLLREKASNERILNNIEVDKFLESLMLMLKREKEKGHKNGIPLISISGLEDCMQPEHLRSILKNNGVDAPKDAGKNAKDNNKNLYSSQFKKVLNFVNYVTDNHLAHFVFVTTNAISEAMDTYSPWRLRRERVWVYYPHDALVKNYLVGPVSESIKMKTNGLTLSDHEINHLIECLGGCLSDIDCAISGFERDLSIYDTVDRLVLDSSIKITSLLESYCNKAQENEGNDKEFHFLSAYLRLWALAEILVAYQGGVKRSFVLREIFQGQTKELYSYENVSIITSFPITGELLHNADFFKDMHLNQSVESVLSYRMERMCIKAASPRILLAFKLILSNKLMIEMTEQVKLKINKLDLLKKRKKFEEILDSWVNRAKVTSEEYTTYIEHKEKILGDLPLTKSVPQNEEISKSKEESHVQLNNYFNRVLEQRNKTQVHIERWTSRLENVYQKFDELDKRQRNMGYFAFDFVKTNLGKDDVGFDEGEIEK